MTLLGLSCGQPRGSAEILLKAALRSAEALGADVELVRLEELDVDGDDAWWLWDELVECDALIISTPIISRTVTGRLKLLGDRLLGPNADAAIVSELMKMRAAGREPAVPFRVDERVLKPRVAGFIAVGGSLTSQWKSLALPVLHTMTFSMQTAVADQVVFEGAGTPRSIVLDDAALERAARLGRNVAEQIGRAFQGVEYRGEEGLCPLCHLDVVVLRGTDVECATCGARGVLAGERVEFSEAGLRHSVITMHEKHEHFLEIQDTAARHNAVRAEIEARAASFDAYDRLIAPGGRPRAAVPHGDQSFRST